MSGETLDKMYIALVGEFSRFTREQYAKRIEALGGVICEPKNDIDNIFYGKLPVEQIHEYKYGLETVFGAYNEVTLLDKLTEVEMDKQDRIPLSRIEYYQTLPTQPEGCTVFMYEVRRMAQELADLRRKIDTVGFNPIIETGPNSYTIDMAKILRLCLGLDNGGIILPGSNCIVLPTEESIKILSESLPNKPPRELEETVDLAKHTDDAEKVGLTFDLSAPKKNYTGIKDQGDSSSTEINLKNSEAKITLHSLTEADIEYFRQTLEGEYVKCPDFFKPTPSNDLVRDAMRWRALVSTPAIRFFGSSGLKEGRKVSGYAHFGAEFWTIHSGRVFSSEESVKNRELLTEYADILVDNVARKADQKISVIIDNPEWLADNSEAWFEGDELKMNIPLKEVLPVITEWLDTAAILQRAETAATERGIWQSVTLHIAGKAPKE